MIVAAARSESEPEKARVALEELCRTYWMPLYTFVRSRGHSVPDAQDLTQSFFAHLIEREIYARADREKGRFRSFLLASLKNFLADAYSREHALKRGGAQEFLPLDESRAEAAESLFQTHFASGEPNGEDRLFERSWAEAVVAAGLGTACGRVPDRRQTEPFSAAKNFPHRERAIRCRRTISWRIRWDCRLRASALTSPACGRVTANCCARRSARRWRPRRKWMRNCTNCFESCPAGEREVI